MMGTGGPTILFLCTHNAGRSQMAAGFARNLGVNVLSGGSNPADDVNPVAVAAMLEKGIDISGVHPQRWTESDLEVADVVVTMGCGDTCPVVPSTRYVDWDLADPAGLSLERVRTVRDEIEQRVRGLLDELGGGESDLPSSAS